MIDEKMETDGLSGEELCQVVVLVNKRGLHARAAAKFVQTASRYKSEIHVVREKTRVSGASIMGLMMLAAPCGAQIKLCASGSEAQLALDELCALVRRGFDEDSN